VSYILNINAEKMFPVYTSYNGRPVDKVVLVIKSLPSWI